jgi:uncharacterized protein YyaL (SSP411 family)
LITRVNTNFVRQLRPAFWALRTRRDPSVLYSLLRSGFDIPYPKQNIQTHIDSALGWLCAAQDATMVNGVSAFYDFRSGYWGPPYPETTGYIIPTFYNSAVYMGNSNYATRATQMAEWLLTLQLDSGAFPIGPLWPDWERTPLVFDTGQIIRGLVAAHLETKQPQYHQSAILAGNWLVDIQDSDGCWRKHTSLEIVHTYNVLVAWALIQLSEAAGTASHREAAIRNIEWAISQQTSDGWFKNAGFRPDEDPLTHTIAYTIEGLLETGIWLGNHHIISAGQKAADALLARRSQDGFLRARYGPGWQSQDDWSCLTGNAQIALLWLKLYQLTGNIEYLAAGQNENSYLMERQPRHAGLVGLSGGLAGSYPAYESYEPYRNLNWAAKYFVDSLIFESQIINFSFR